MVRWPIPSSNWNVSQRSGRMRGMVCRRTNGRPSWWLSSSCFCFFLFQESQAITNTKEYKVAQNKALVWSRPFHKPAQNRIVKGCYRTEKRRLVYALKQKNRHEFLRMLQAKLSTLSKAKLDGSAKGVTQHLGCFHKQGTDHRESGNERGRKEIDETIQQGQERVHRYHHSKQPSFISHLHYYWRA